MASVSSANGAPLDGRTTAIVFFSARFDLFQCVSFDFQHYNSGEQLAVARLLCSCLAVGGREATSEISC